MYPWLFASSKRRLNYGGNENLSGSVRILWTPVRKKITVDYCLLGLIGFECPHIRKVTKNSWKLWSKHSCLSHAYNNIANRLNSVSLTINMHAWSLSSIRLIVNEMELSLLSTLFVATAGTQWKWIRLIKLWKCKHYFKQAERCYFCLIFPYWGVIWKCRI